VPNPRGAQRALDAGFTEVEVVVSASDTHNRRNVNRSTDESLDDIASLVDMLHRGGATAEVIIATSFGCPYEGDVDPGRVAAIVDRVVADGADRVAFGDDAAVGGGLVVWDADGPCFCADAVADPVAGLVAAAAAGWLP
jgi:hydroxymethylglutaryl-CoA lyase